MKIEDIKSFILNEKNDRAGIFAQVENFLLHYDEAASSATHASAELSAKQKAELDATSADLVRVTAERDALAGQVKGAQVTIDFLRGTGKQALEHAAEHNAKLADVEKTLAGIRQGLDAIIHFASADKNVRALAELEAQKQEADATAKALAEKIAALKPTA